VAGVPPDKLAEFTAAIPIGRLAAADEGTPAVGFVASAAARLDRQYPAAVPLSVEHESTLV